MQISKLRFESEGQGTEARYVEMVFGMSNKTKLNSARIRIRQTPQGRFDLGKVRSCCSTANPTNRDGPLPVLRYRFVQIPQAIDDRRNYTDIGIKFSSIVRKYAAAGDDMDAPSQDFIHALAVLKSIQERMVYVRSITVA